MFLKYLFKVVQVLSFLLMILGAAMMDSESLLIPTIFVLAGAGILSFTSWIEGEYVEF